MAASAKHLLRIVDEFSSLALSQMGVRSNRWPWAYGGASTSSRLLAPAKVGVYNAHMHMMKKVSAQGLVD
jgi:hypothetical protein